MLTSRALILALASLALPCVAADHPVGGPRRHHASGAESPAPQGAESPAPQGAESPAPKAPESPAPAGTDAATPPPPKGTALLVSGIPVSMRSYRQAMKDAEESWRQLLAMFPEERLHEHGLSKREFLFLHEVAEPLIMRARHLSEIPELERLADECYRRAVAGEDMAMLSLKYSTDLRVRQTAGDSGLIGFSDLVHPANRRAWRAEVGEVLPPVQSIYGYHVIKVTAIMPAHEAPGPDGAPPRHIPELRRIRQALLSWNSDKIEDDPGFQVLRHEIAELDQDIAIEVVDDRLCTDLPTWCAARPGPWLVPGSHHVYEIQDAPAPGH